MEANQVNEMLRERASLKFSIIGVGNAGNQLLNVAYKHGYDTFAINSSRLDLDHAVTIKEIPSYIVGREARGAGKVRKKAVELFKDTGEELFTNIPYFSEMCDRSDVIVVSGATAGGTGSGICPPLIGLLKQMYPSKIIMYVGILPRLTDSVAAQENSIGCLTEIFDCNVPYILADLNFYSGVPNDQAYDKIQQYIIDCLNVLSGKYLHTSSYGMIDENDMRMVIQEPGYLSIYNLSKVTQDMLDKESMQSRMVNLIKRSPAVSIQFDKIIKNMAAIVNISEDLTDSSRAGDYDELSAAIGRPLAVYENYAVSQTTADGQMIIVLSGQTIPMNRIDKMIEIKRVAAETQKNQKRFESALSDAVSTSLTGDRSLPSGESLDSDTKAGIVAGFFNKN